MTPEHADLLNHLSVCPNCTAPADKYCPAGRLLWIDHNARWFLDQDKLTRQRELVDLKRNEPLWALAIENRVRELFGK